MEHGCGWVQERLRQILMAWNMGASARKPCKCHSTQKHNTITFDYANARAPKVRSIATIEPSKTIVPRAVPV